jgi:hypothetical protein
MISTPDDDRLVPDPQVREEFGITEMTEWRWDNDPQMAALGWHAKVKIRKRNYRSRRALNDFKENLLRRALQERKVAHADQSYPLPIKKEPQ